MKPTSQDQHDAWRLARRSLLLIVVASVSVLTGSAAVLTSTIVARAVRLGNGHRGLPILDAQGWFPGWPAWTVTLFIIGIALLLTAAIAFFVMNRTSHRTQALLDRLRSTSQNR